MIIVIQTPLFIIILSFRIQMKKKRKLLKNRPKQSYLFVKATLSNGSTLADLYDPLAMPVDLLKAHQKLDKLVDKAYGKNFKTDEERVAHLFELYAEKQKELIK